MVVYAYDKHFGTGSVTAQIRGHTAERCTAATFWREDKTEAQSIPLSGWCRQDPEGYGVQ